MKGSFRFILGFFMILASFTLINSTAGLTFMSGLLVLIVGVGFMYVGTKDLAND